MFAVRGGSRIWIWVWGTRSTAEDTRKRIEVLQAHRVYGVMYGCPLPIGGGVWRRGHTY